MLTKTIAGIALAAPLLAFAVVRGQQGPAPQAPQILTESLAGRDSFQLYCAPCHGQGGRGDGPVASALRARPSDLTTLSRRNAGTYPRARVSAFVTGTGRTTAAHGTTEMPIWGPLFRAFESDARVRARLDALVEYVETIQEPSTERGDVGNQLFRTYCASCHGADARGAGPAASAMRTAPPDLTGFTSRNGGTFPGERVRRIIEGRDVVAHGSREMPVWGDAFQRSPAGLSEGTARRRIDAIADYLERIQERGTF